MNISYAQLNISSPTVNYWQSELASKSETTKEIYLKNFAKFIEFIGKTPEELIRQRQENQTNKDPKVQRQIESLLIKFIAAEKNKGLAPATLQTYFASIRSFFEINYYPLRMRRGDYPKGESIGVRIANKETILKALDHNTARYKAISNAAILFLKDSGLRVSDARLLNYCDISEQLKSGAKTIPITLITQKVKIAAKTFIGEEAINSLKIYLAEREKGTRRISPERLAENSPLFRTTESKTVKRIPRTTLSNVVRAAFCRINETNISAHSLRKYLQTNLEAAGVNSNWIDQMLGHQLINSRDAYSKPTDEQLREAYTNAYKFLRVYPELNNSSLKVTTPSPKIQTSQSEVTKQTEGEEYIVETATNIKEATELIRHGFQHDMTIDGTMIFKKPK